MPRTAFTSDAAPKPKNPSVSQGVKAGNIVMPSGQVGRKLDGTMPQDIEGQARVAFENVIAVLAAGGATEADVVHVRLYLTDQEQISVVNQVFDDTFSEPSPARTAIFVELRPGTLIEVDALAVVA